MTFEQELVGIWEAHKFSKHPNYGKLWSNLDDLGDRYPKAMYALYIEVLNNENKANLEAELWNQLMDFFENVAVSEGYAWKDENEPDLDI